MCSVGSATLGRRDRMGVVVIDVLNGLTYAALLLVVAAGLSLLFGFLHIVNFAHGAMYMVGAYVAMTVGSHTHSFALAVLGAIVVVGLLTIVMKLVVLRPLGDASPTDYILVTFGVLLILENAVRVIWGTSSFTVAGPSSTNGAVEIGDIRYPVYRLLIVGIVAVVMGALAAFIRFSATGRQIRAVVEDQEMAKCIGINAARLSILVLVIGGGLAGLGGALAGPYLGVTPTMDESILVDSFLVVIVSGLGSLGATFGGACLVGVVYTLGNSLASSYSETLVLIVVIVALIWRPDGVFVRRGAE